MSRGPSSAGTFANGNTSAKSVGMKTRPTAPSRAQVIRPKQPIINDAQRSEKQVGRESDLRSDLQLNDQDIYEVVSELRIGLGATIEEAEIKKLTTSLTVGNVLDCFASKLTLITADRLLEEFVIATKIVTRRKVNWAESQKDISSSSVMGLKNAALLGTNETSIGIYILCYSPNASETPQPVLGLRDPVENPNITFVVGSEESLEVWGFKPQGRSYSIAVDGSTLEERVMVCSLDSAVSGLRSEIVEPLETPFLRETGFNPGLICAWHVTERDGSRFWLLAYRAGIYGGGLKPDETTFGSSLYALVGFNSGLGTLPTNSTNKTESKSAPTGITRRGSDLVENPASDFKQRTKKLVHSYPVVAARLREVTQGVSLGARDFDNVAAQVYLLGQLWLTWFDGEHFEFTQDKGIYDSIVNLANSPPRCSVEQEALSWMRMTASNLTRTEIKLALQCPVYTLGETVLLNGQIRETLDDLLMFAEDRVGQ